MANISCPECDPPELSPFPLNENHLAMRFNYMQKVWSQYKHAVATLNGEDVSARCIETLPSDGDKQGFVVLYDEPRQICKCGNGIKCKVIYGDVRVEIKEGRP